MTGRTVGLLGAAAVAVTMLAGCGEKYPTNVESNFLNACEMRGGSASRCGCALGWLESNVSFAQYTAAEAEMYRTGALPASVAGAVAAC